MSHFWGGQKKRIGHPPVFVIKREASSKACYWRRLISIAMNLGMISVAVFHADLFHVHWEMIAQES